MQRQRVILGLVVVLLVAVAGWWLGTATEESSPQTTVTVTAEPRPGEHEVDPESGLRWIAAAELPPEARRTLALIESGGPFPFERDGVVFQNREGILPDEERGYYHEYTVRTPDSDDRGARRVVAGAGGERYYTDDHYDSFRRISP